MGVSTLGRGRIVARPGPLNEPFRNLSQQLVAQIMTERVIDVLEIVQVKKEYGDQLIAALREFEQLIQLFLEHHTVRQAGQTVVVGQNMDLFDHAGVGERHGDLINQLTDMEQVIRIVILSGRMAQGDDGRQLLFQKYGQD